MAPNLSFHYFTATLPLILVFFSAMRISCVIADPAKDIADCTDQLVGLATCIPDVSGQARAPTPDCCSGLKQVLKDNKKCLCVVIKDRNDPNLDLQINVTLALSLPSVCNAPANVSKCPELLHMDPHSPEAQVFYQLAGNNSTQTASGPAPSPTAGGPISTKSKGLSSSRGAGKEKSGRKAIIGGVLLWTFIGLQWFM
ncbi:Bifunctional inhibitor/plant lipid transfer protein/seed storage helical domain containing protein [Trema orientale]|uniref:Bifunctional inhibitor/plant lipid transfer protein/seed storage helical domain containing protein n=1 Tax=Trema orientale TaxID=63057 RepID=A0A2P5AR98_TREOI|nr:Bifunctional inhibitor/plant lipid transfer protein/seed storage helical domain containing protein [Trema orientale]